MVTLGCAPAALLTTLALLVLAAAGPAMANRAGVPLLKVGQPVMAPGDQITVRGLGYKPQADANLTMDDKDVIGLSTADGDGNWPMARGLVAADLSSDLPRRAPGVA